MNYAFVFCIYKPTKKSKHVYSLIVYDYSQETAHIQHTKTINGTNFLVLKREGGGGGGGEVLIKLRLLALAILYNVILFCALTSFVISRKIMRSLEKEGLWQWCVYHYTSPRPLDPSLL